ncbi:glycosyltransferase family 2 protein [Candidatus Margulisiibacteriota bacterium]
MAPDISVVILCYKAGRKVEDFVNKVVAETNKISPNYEIILVGNYVKGDTNDDTPHAVKEIATKDPKLKAITLEKKGMMGWDARAGMNAATGNTIALIDGDGQMLPEDLGKVYRKLIDERLDIVKTYRQKREDGILRKINSNVYNLLFRFLFPGYKVKDVNSKPKIFTRGFFNKLKLSSNDWFLDAEIMIQARRYKGRLGEIPTVFLEIQNRRSFIRAKYIIEFLVNFLIARLKEFFTKK